MAMNRTGLGSQTRFHNHKEQGCTDTTFFKPSKSTSTVLTFEYLLITNEVVMNYIALFFTIKRT